MTASSLYLNRFLKTRPDLLAQSSSSIISPSYIDPSATIDPTAKIGPNVAIGPGVVIGPGVRVKDAIIFEGSTLDRHSCVLNSIVGANCQIGAWARVDGFPEPEKDVKGQISVTVLGELVSFLVSVSILMCVCVCFAATEVSLAPETLVRSCIVLPNVSLLSSKAMASADFFTVRNPSLAALQTRCFFEPPHTMRTFCTLLSSWRGDRHHFLHAIYTFKLHIHRSRVTSPACDQWRLRDRRYMRPGPPRRHLRRVQGTSVVMSVCSLIVSVRIRLDSYLGLIGVDLRKSPAWARHEMVCR